MRSGLVLGIAIALVACGESTPPSTTTAPAPTATSPSLVTTTTGAASAGPATVVAILSGRGDDGSFEVAVHFDRPPGDSRILVGIDADDSYPGSGDPAAHLDGWVELDDLVVVGSDGAVVAGGSGPGIGEWVSWGLDGSTLRVFFIRDLAPVAGTLWVVVGEGGESGTVAGTVAGEGCSVRGSGRDVTVSGEVPDPGVPCRYP